MKLLQTNKKCEKISKLWENKQIDCEKISILIYIISDGLVGMAIVGGAAAVAVGGLVGLGFALSKK